MPLDVVTCLLLEGVRRRLNESPRFRESARGWTASILVEILPEQDVPYSYRTYIEIADGECRGIRVLEPEEEVEADVTVKMGISTYLDLLTGRTSSAVAFLLGRVKMQGKTRELLSRKGVLEELNSVMREMLFGGGALRVLLPLVRREFTF